MDNVTKERRSWIMRQVKQKNTAPEILFAKLLRANKIRFRRHLKNLPGSPDFVIKEFKTVVFIHGCFWHGHKNCKLYKLPASNTLFWEQKIMKNRTRDSSKTKSLRKLGWRVLVVWQCQLRKADFLPKILDRITRPPTKGYQ